MSKLLAIFNQKDKLEGKAQLKMNFTAIGTSAPDIRNSLSGQATLDVSNGKFYGADLITVLKEAQLKIDALVSGLTKGKVLKNIFSLVPKMSKDLQESKKAIGPQQSTPFQSAKATVQFANGVANNPDLFITHPEYEIRGAGNVQLVSEQIQYTLSVLLKNSPLSSDNKMAAYLLQAPLPVLIKGTLSNPSIRPDYTAYFTDALKFAQKHFVQDVIKEKIQDKIKEQINDKIKDKLGDNLLKKIPLDGLIKF
jgi:AsmA protein